MINVDSMDVEPNSSDVTQKQIVLIRKEQDELKISARIDDRKS